MFIADFILGHWLLFLMFPILMVPQIGKLHSITLFWLLPRYVLISILCSSA
jgi:1,3-beta-glucan synthase